MHFLTVIWQLKTRHRKIMPFVLAVVAKSCNLRCVLPCWMFFNSSILSSNTVILHPTVMDQTVVPMCEVCVGGPLNSAPVYWTRISDVDTNMLFLPTIPSKHSKVFTWQISQCSGCISCTRTMNFPQCWLQHSTSSQMCWLQHSTSQLLQSSKERFSLKNEGFLS